MEHAGAIVSDDGTGNAENKGVKLAQAGAHIAESTEHIVEIIGKILN